MRATDPIGDITVRKHADGLVEVIEAAPLSRVSLEMLSRADSRDMGVTGDRITIAAQVVYQVIGWDQEHAALLVRLIEDRREP